MTKKVSVVVPAYNAEKTIGRCLGSLMGQTYNNFEVIIVNDGSTDRTLKISKNYAKLDERFQTLTIKNGGVSNARNVGIERADGAYLTFVDSDDMVHPDYLKEMVMAMERYGTGLVISDLTLLDFSHPERRVVLSGKNFVRKMPLVLNKSEFDGKMMELTWKTSLIESGCGKLMDLKMWKKHGIKLDTGLSLGEDFLANLEYYEYTNGVVFLNKSLYYYNNVEESGSLSHAYRKDLFRIKMRLADGLRQYLGGNIDGLPKKEREYYYNYVAAYGINTLEALINTNRYQGRKEKIAGVEEIVDNEMFREAVQAATYLKYPKWKDMIMDGEVRKLLMQKTKNAEEMGGPWKNRVARKLMRFYFCDIMGNRSRGLEIDNELSTLGIKGTIMNELRKK